MKKLSSRLMLGLIFITISNPMIFAQPVVPPILPDIHVANVTTTDNYIPNSSTDDVVINCDMLTDVSTGQPLKAIAWDEGHRSRTTHLYFEDWLGNVATLPVDEPAINGHRPDIVLGNDMSQPDQNYRAAVVYIGIDDRPYVKFYTLTGAGTPAFAATPTSLILLSTVFQINSFSPAYHDTDPLPHIDMWSDTELTVVGAAGSYHGMQEWVATWSEVDPSNGGSNVFYAHGHIDGTPLTLKTLVSQTFHGGLSDMSDVACYTDISTGRRYAAFTYRTNMLLGAFRGLVVTEFDMTVLGAHTAIAISDLNVSWAFMPRIEAMSLYDGLMQPSKWEVVTTANYMLPGFSPQHPFCFNDQAAGAGFPLAGWNAMFGNQNIKSPCVAAGLQYTTGATEIGNKYYSAGFYPWGLRELYVRPIDAINGWPWGSSYYLVNSNLLGTWPPEYNSADASKSFALSNCSNTGEWLLSAWYDGQDVGGGTGGSIWMKLSSDAYTLQFKSMAVAMLTGEQLGLYPNPATDAVYLNQQTGYKIYNLTGRQVKAGQSNVGEPIEITELAAGMYLLQTTAGATHKFTKQ